MLRVRDIPQGPENRSSAKVAVLFSGGIDSTMLAFLAHRYAKIRIDPIVMLMVFRR